MKGMKSNRRQFLSKSGLGLVSAAFLASRCGPTPETVFAPDQALDFGPFRMGFQSYSLRHFTELDDLVREAGRLGVPHAEIYRGHLAVDAPPETILEVREALAGVGVTVNAYGVERFSADHERNENLFRFGQQLGVMNLSAAPTLDAFDSLEELVARYDIRIAIHNHGPEDELWQFPQAILEAVEGRDSRIGACVDTGHYLRSGVDPIEAIRLLGSRVLGVHFKDYDRDLNEVIPGDGQLDVAAALEALRDVGFNGPLSLEYEEHPEDPVPHMKVALERISGVLSQWKGAAA
jgi:inosose dehydratase